MEENNMIIDLSVLKLIPTILQELEELKAFKNEFLNNKTYIKSTEVLEILGLKSRATIKNYVDNCVFKENEHYIKEDNKIKFIYKEILNFKKANSKSTKSLHKKSEEQLEFENALKRLAA